jgi:hypothetical protein
LSTLPVRGGTFKTMQLTLPAHSVVEFGNLRDLWNAEVQAGTPMPALYVPRSHEFTAVDSFSDKIGSQNMKQVTSDAKFENITCHGGGHYEGLALVEAALTHASQRTKVTPPSSCAAATFGAPCQYSFYFPVAPALMRARGAAAITRSHKTRYHSMKQFLLEIPDKAPSSSMQVAVKANAGCRMSH